MLNEYLRKIFNTCSTNEIDELVSQAAMDHDICDYDLEIIYNTATGQKHRLSHPSVTRKMISILIGFERKEDGKIVDDETQFDVEIRENGELDLIQLLELWGTFCCENGFSNVGISYIEEATYDPSLYS